VVSEGRVVGVLVDGAPAPVASAGQQVEIVLDRTPFYAEGGGQLADAGRIELDGAVVEVDDVQSPITGLIVHRGRVVSGEVTVGDVGQALVDIERRKAISRSHTATHMVHKAIREALGDTATQAGSENSPGRFRFDFHAASALPTSALRDVEARVNALLIDDLEVHAELMTQEQARAAGAMALFGEKYGDQVRVISVGDWARELCGGTHARRSGQLGLIKLLGEGSIGSGVRRVEALVGTDAYAFSANEHVLVSQLTDALKVRADELPDRVAGLVTQLRDAQKEIEKFRAGQVLAVAGTLSQTPKDVFGVAVVTHDAGEAGADDLRALALDVRGRLGAGRPAVVAVGGVAKGRPLVVIAANDEARRWGVAAGELVSQAAKVLGGGGGGKPDVAQGGGTDAERLPEALRLVEHAVGQKVTAGR
jgi:alanyl-tRNA synthetase